MHRNHIGRCRHIDDGGEIGQWVVGVFGVDGGVCRGGGHRGHAQRVTIGRRLGGLIRANHTTTAGLVDHHHRLAQGLAQGLSNGASHNVGRTTGCEGNLQLNRFGGVALRKGTASQG